MGAAPQRLQLKRSKGWRMPPDTVKVDRTTRFGNPFVLSQYGRDPAVALFSAWIGGEDYPGSVPRDVRAALTKRRRHMLEAVSSLRGKNLACWCPLPQAGEKDQCHAAVLLELANR
jgi:hypothetical protein